MFKDGKAQHNAAGKVTQAASYQSRELPKARVEPNRKWFTNSRVISQESLQSFREAMTERAADPYQVLLKTNKLPMSLIRDGQGKNGLKQHQAKIAVESAPYSDTFGPKAQRKRVKLGVGSLADLAGETVKMHDNYLDRLEQAKLLSGTSGVEDQAGEAAAEEDIPSTAREPIFSKGQRLADFYQEIINTNNHPARGSIMNFIRLLTAQTLSSMFLTLEILWVRVAVASNRI